MTDKPTILIVEDDLDLAEMLSAYFRVQNYEVLTAAWGKDAIEISQDARLALVVLDIRLPDIDGYEVCRQLRSQRRTENVPVIFLTERRDRVDKLHGLELGVVDYITKPFDVQELRLRVRNAISRAARQTNTNPVTELPEPQLVEEKLNSLVLADDPWSLLLISVTGLSTYRERYGFVAADDVMRAITLMVRNAVREFGLEDDFIGHLGPEDFLIVTGPERVHLIRQRVETRVSQSSEYFYPLRDREEDAAPNVIGLRFGRVDSAARAFQDAADLKQALFADAGFA